VGVIIPLVTSSLSGDRAIRSALVRSASGFILDSLRGLSETIQFGQGEKRLADMNSQTDSLSKYEERMKRAAGRNTAITTTVILVFDLAMLFFPHTFAL
jgi:ATP-binding cassette subfamily C protein